MGSHPSILVICLLVTLELFVGIRLTGARLANEHANISPLDSQIRMVSNLARNQHDSREQRHIDESANADDSHKAHKCSRQSIQLARQTLAHELDKINENLSIWLNDADKEELMEEQKESLSSVIGAGLTSTLLGPDGQPWFEVESSYLRPYQAQPNSTVQPMSLRLMRRVTDRCYLDQDNFKYSYVTRLALGPLEHNLDVVYNFPKDLRLSQPTSWKYAHVRLLIPRMIYEVTFRQIASYKLDGSHRERADRLELYSCPLEVLDVTYLPPQVNQLQTGASRSAPVSVIGSGLAANNQTALQLERLFNDYTRPTISIRLRQLLKFHLSSKTLPLSS